MISNEKKAGHHKKESNAERSQGQPIAGTWNEVVKENHYAGHSAQSVQLIEVVFGLAHADEKSPRLKICRAILAAKRESREKKF